MTRKHQEGRIRFTFPEDWIVFRPGDSAYYKRRFQGFCGGCKEMDFVGWEPNHRTLWLLEVKDYTTDRRIKPSSIFDEVAVKVRDTLALLIAASVNANPDHAGTLAFSKSCLPPESIRVVLHVEQASKPSKLFPAIKGMADAIQLLRSKLRCIDSHALVVSLDCPAKSPWVAEWQP